MDQMLVTKSSSKPSNQKSKFAWPEAQSIKQYFSFPSSIIYHMARNPLSPESYLKMIKICKYFFEKQPLLIAAQMKPGEICSCLNHAKCFQTHSFSCCVKINLEQTNSKLWLINARSRYTGRNVKCLLPLHSKIYRCENSEIELQPSKMYFNEFISWSSIFTKFYFHGINVTDNGKNVLKLEKVLEFLPYVKEFWCLFGNKTPELTSLTMKNILHLKNLSNLQLFHLYDIPEIFDVDDLAEFIRIFQTTKICLKFCSDMSQEYMIKLDGLADAIIESGIPNRIIFYDGMDEEKCEIMESRYTED